MKGSCLFLCLLSTTCCLTLMPTAGNKIFHFGPCRVPMSMAEIRSGFNAIKASVVRGLGGSSFKALWESFLKQAKVFLKSSERCCITHQLFTFYVDKVFKHCRTEDSYINRKISSIANSFLSVRRNLQHCLNVTSAAIKSLGELDILLDWVEK
ncbi:Interleukin-20, partial [Dryobates pubescens]